MAARGLDFIKDLNPSKEQWRIKVRVIRLWKQKNFRQPKLGDNIELLLLDELGGRIQATLRPSLRFKDAFNEGQVYTISNFGVSLNEDPFKPTTHQYKIVFNPRTAQSLVNDSYIPHYGFSFIEFDKILKETRENAFLVDVIGMLSVVVERKELTKNGSPLHMISFELDDLSGNKLRCTLWENFADEMCSVVDKNLNEPVIFVIQFAKMKSWKGVMGISNTMFNTKIFINNYDILEVLAFKKRIPAGEGLHVEKLSTTNSGTSSLDDVLLSTSRKTIVEIKESREIMTCLTLAEIMCIESTHNWFYKSCYNCTNGVEHDFGIWYCKKCDKGWSSPRLRYCIKVRVVDGTDAASLILFDSAAMGFLNISASDLRELHLKRGGNPETYPVELDALKNKKMIFRLSIKQNNINCFEESVYHVGKIFLDEKVIESFLQTFEQPVGSSEIQNFSSGGSASISMKEHVDVDEISHTGDNCVEDALNEGHISSKRSFIESGLDEVSDNLFQQSATKMKRIKTEKD